MWFEKIEFKKIIWCVPGFSLATAVAFVSIYLLKNDYLSSITVSILIGLIINTCYPLYQTKFN